MLRKTLPFSKVHLCDDKKALKTVLQSSIWFPFERVQKSCNILIVLQMGKIKKKLEPNRGSPSQSILRNLMLRDYGFHITTKRNTKELEPVAESNLVLKNHQELVI